MTEYINGPTNFAHLRGSIDGQDKNIYFFMDSHYDLDNQTRCESFNSIDISQYLYKKIIEAKQQLDFFMEIRSTHIDTLITNKRDIYIKDVVSLFKSEYIVEKKEDDKIIRHSKSNPIVKLHYLDIRDHLELFGVLNIIEDDIKKNVELLINNYEKKNKYIQNIFDNIKLINNKIEKMMNIKNEVSGNADVFLKHPESNTYDKITEPQKYYLNKIINIYENKNLKIKMNEFINKYYKQVVHKLNKALEKFVLEIEDFSINDKTIIYELVDSIKEDIIDLYSLFTDAFLLRRILDKNYIKKSIVYSGSQHSINCIFFLIKYYGFKIIKIHDSSEKNTDILMDNILNTKHVFNIYKFFNMNDRKKQCIDYEILRDGGNRILYD